MRHPAARCPRLVSLAVLIAACAAGDSAPPPVVVEVAAQPCTSPNRSRGLGVVVADGVVATAGHTVDGALRDLQVDGRPARVLTVDHRTDLALLAVASDAEPAGFADGTPDAATLVRPGGHSPVRIVHTGPLIVDDTTDGERYERLVHTFTPGVEDGTSGAPLVDEDGRLLGIVVLDDAGRGVAYAVTARELSTLLERSGDRPAGRIGDC